jgi:uncharacterized protein (DUF2235 family)
MANESYVCRRLIVLLDGTWNDADDAAPATNIVYLRELLFWGLQRRFDKPLDADKEDNRKLDAGQRKKAASGMIFDGFEYIVYYGRGVGTNGLVDRFKGGVLGVGLDQDIRRAYKFLSQWFRPGDEIYVFGFSRGAFTARSLAGYLYAVGLLRPEFCSPENEQRAWDFYRTPPQDRLSADWHFFRKPLLPDGTALVHPESAARIRALCVFDTVGALGVPGNLFREVNRAKYEFHDTDVTASVDIRLHAVAIDEPRPEFVATMWTKPKFQHFNLEISPIEQAWFPGAHADVGGGYVPWDDRSQLGLSHVPLVWMLQRLNHHITAREPFGGASPPVTPTIEPKRRAPIPFYEKDFFADTTWTKVLERISKLVDADQHKPWEVVSSALGRPDNHRIINQVPLASAGQHAVPGRVPHADPIGEMIHVSALERLNREIKIEKKTTAYSPTNLVGAIPFIAASYLGHDASIDADWAKIVGPIFSWRHILVVNWDGTPLLPTEPDHVREVSKLLPKPAAIRVSAMPAEMRQFLLPAPAAA